MKSLAWILGALGGLLFWVAVCLLLWWTCIGCRQLPVFKGEFQDSRVEQAKVDSKQSDRIADLTEIEDGMGTVLTVVAPEEVKPQVQAVRSKITAVKAQAQAQAVQHRERAQQEERKLEELNSAPGIGSWVSAALGGNWGSLVEMLLGALGAGGALHGVRMSSRADRMAKKCVSLADEDPETARKMVAVDPDLAKHRKKT